MVDAKLLIQSILQFLQKESTGTGPANHVVTVVPNPDGSVELDLSHEVLPSTIAKNLAEAVANGVGKGLAPFVSGGEGLPGRDGSKWWDGDGAPPANLGKNGDYYIDLGEDDVEHARPTRWYEGSGAPSLELGYENDLYLRTDTSDVYVRGYSSWGDPILHLAPTQSGTASALKTTGADVVISGSAPPLTGQILVALSPTAAAWATGSSTGGSGTATALHETGGPTDLTIGAIADGMFLKRVGSTVVGATAGGGGTTPTGTGCRIVVDGVEQAAARFPTSAEVGADATGAAAAVASAAASALAAHTGATGTAVHGLGTAAIHAATDFDPTGSAAAVAAAAASALSAHATLTTGAHGGVIPASAAGATGGVATLDASAKVPTTQLPPITEAMLSLSDVATANAGTGAHGLMRKLSGDGSKYIGGDGLEHTFTVSGSAHSFGGGYVSDSVTPRVTQTWQLDVTAFPPGTVWHVAAVAYGAADTVVELWDVTADASAGTFTISASGSPAVGSAVATMYYGAPHYYELRFHSSVEGVPVYLGAANLYYS